MSMMEGLELEVRAVRKIGKWDSMPPSIVAGSNGYTLQV